MNKRLKFLKWLIRVVIYFTMAFPIVYIVKVPTDGSVLAGIGYVLTMTYCVSFCLYVSSKFADWLFKGVDE